MPAANQDARHDKMEASHQSTSRPNISTRGVQLTDAEAEAIMEAYQMEEEKEMTWTRFLVEKYLQHYKWYFPRKDIPGAPSLQKAWAYYEHVTLPRHFPMGPNSGGTVLRRAEPGEQEETELYKPLMTGQSHLIEFGIGVDLYFQTCALICAMFFLAGLINIPSIYYYAVNYSGDKDRGWALSGSAVCTETYWAVCENCLDFAGEFDEKQEEADRFAVQVDPVNGDRTVFLLRNNCEIGLNQAIVNWATWVFFFLFLTAVSMYLRAREIRFDEDKLTASDYSVEVKNPPPDAMDPEEWRAYFEQFAEKQVTVVSIHLNNEEMLNKLVQRRESLDMLRRMLPKGTNMEDESTVRIAVDTHCRDRDLEPKGCFGMFLECIVFWPLRKVGMMRQAETLLERVYSLTDEIKELQKQRYDVSKVFATFETEEGQRAALTALSASRLDIMMNNTEKAPPSAVFHGRVLRVIEPTEPNAVRWRDLSASKRYRYMSGAMTLGVTIGLIALAGTLEDLTRQQLGPGFSGPLVSIFNGIIPIFVRVLMMFEKHATEGGFQSSLYLKITLFRWVNTAIALLVITPFTATTGPAKTDLLPSISAILWSETFITPAIRLLDIGSNMQKHIIAPRAMTQETCNLNFLGTPYNLGERYTDLTKVLFVCFFYSALFPASFLFGFAILFVQYHVDKFCLLRVWGFSPSLGNTLAVYSRRYFFTGATVAFIIASSYAYAQFPYDNACDNKDSSVTPANTTFDNVLYLNSTTLLEATQGNGQATPVNITVGQEEPVYFCHQGSRQQDGFAFPPKVDNQPEDLRWMTDDQETIVTTYYWSVIVALVIFLVGAFLTTIMSTLKSWFRSGYRPEGASQQIDFSCNPEIVAYVPQVKLRTYPFPFLAANVDDLDESLLEFTDHEHSIDEHNMIFDVPGYPGMHRSRRSNHSSDQSSSPLGENPSGTVPGDHRPIFGVVKHYPPPWFECANGAS